MPRGNPTWTKGISGNPAGRPKDTIGPLARERSIDAFNTIVALLESKDEKVRLRAAEIILERGFGKPVQQIEGSVDHVVQMATIKIGGRIAEFHVGD